MTICTYIYRKFNEDKRVPGSKIHFISNKYIKLGDFSRFFVSRNVNHSPPPVTQLSRVAPDFPNTSELLPEISRAAATPSWLGPPAFGMRVLNSVIGGKKKHTECTIAGAVIQTRIDIIISAELCETTCQGHARHVVSYFNFGSQKTMPNCSSLSCREN